MGTTDGFYLDPDNVLKLKERVKKRGDKSKIVNEALKQYFLPNKIEKVTTRSKGEIIGVEIP